MITHPLNLAVLTCDAATVLLLLMAAVSCLRIVTGWRTGDATREQLRLERRSEAVSLQGRLALSTLLLGTVVYVVSVSSALPAIVPGAMCGTGVVQATGGLAARALALRFVALWLLVVWSRYDDLDRSAPTAPLGTTPARLLLLATPVGVLAGLDTASALASLDVHAPVDCCAIVYDQVAPSLGGAGTMVVSDTFLIWATWILGVLLFCSALLVWRGRGPLRGTLSSALLAGLALLWAPLAAVALVRVFSAYHYGVLHHHCPWCLFLALHHWVGFPFFGALAVVLLDGTGPLIAARVTASVPQVSARAILTARRSARRVVLALILFALLSGLPALLWRLRHGVWITG